MKEIRGLKGIYENDIIAWCRSDMKIKEINDEKHEFHYYSKYGKIEWHQDKLCYDVDSVEISLVDILNYKDYMIIGNTIKSPTLLKEKIAKIFK